MREYVFALRIDRMLLSMFCTWFLTLWKSSFPRNPPTPRKLLPLNPPSPSEFPIVFRGGGMDIFWNHTFSFKHSSNFFLCVGYFSRKKSFLFFPHLSNLAVRIEFTELIFSTCSRYCWNHCHFIFFSLMFSTGSESQDYCKM